MIALKVEYQSTSVHSSSAKTCSTLFIEQIWTYQGWVTRTMARINITDVNRVLLIIMTLCAFKRHLKAHLFSSNLRCWQVGSALFVRRHCDCLASLALTCKISRLTYLLTYSSRELSTREYHLLRRWIHWLQFTACFKKKTLNVADLSKHLNNIIDSAIFVLITFVCVLYAPPIGGALSDDAVWRLSVCLSRTSGLSREQRGLGRLKLTKRYA